MNDPYEEHHASLASDDGMPEPCPAPAAAAPTTHPVPVPTP